MELHLRSHFFTGDNAWPIHTLKSALQPEFRQAFGKNFNLGYDDKFKFTSAIGNSASRPLGTPYAETSFAIVHRNTLIVTVDVLYQQSPYVEIGSLGTVSGEVNGAHLQWLDNLLAEGSKLPEVKHIVVQGHFPVLFPVRKTKSSGIYMDRNEESSFWKVLRKHPVDIYFAGECHLNSVSKDVKSDIIQIVSRGNFFSNFLSIDFTDDLIDVTSYNEIGQEKTMENFNYEVSGHIRISKFGKQKAISTSGDLSYFDPENPMLYFNFESEYSLEDRQVLGLGELPGARRVPIVTNVEVRGIICKDTLVNAGAFGQDYDAQSANIQTTSGVYGYGGKFTAESRAAVFGMGPHSGTNPISYTLWSKTTSFGNRILLSYEGFWNKDNVMNLRLRDGKLELVYSETQKIFVKDGVYNDGFWHHFAATMPFNGCKLSQVKLYVDGIELPSTLVGIDSIIDLPNGGMIGVGSFGYGGVGSPDPVVRKGLREGLNFVGSLDDVMVFARPLGASEVEEISTPPVSFALRNKLSYELEEAMCLGFDLFGNRVVLRSCTDEDGQQWVQDVLGYVHNKLRYESCLSPELQGDGSTTVRVEDCNDRNSNDFSWTLGPGFILHSESGTLLSVNTHNSNAIELVPDDPGTEDLPENGWDIVYEGGFAPSYLTGIPSVAPTKAPSSEPSTSPTAAPTSSPSSSPTSRPSTSPSMSPTSNPSSSPSQKPTSLPTVSPTFAPSVSPSVSPTSFPTGTPTFLPSSSPSSPPSNTYLFPVWFAFCTSIRDAFWYPHSIAIHRTFTVTIGISFRKPHHRQM